MVPMTMMLTMTKNNEKGSSVSGEVGKGGR